MTRGQTLTIAAVRSLRLTAQLLVGRPASSGCAVVRHLGAVQAQDYPAALWGISRRTSGASWLDLEREHNDGAILRTHVLRPTWHFVTPDDINWMLQVTAPGVHARMRPYNEKLGLGTAILHRCLDVIARELEGGRHRTRQELRTALSRGGVSSLTTTQLGHVMMYAELEQVVCSGVRRGANSTYALLAERAPSARVLDRDEALLELARRYFRSRSPATVQDFAWWSGLRVSDARRAVEIAGAELRQASLDGATMYATRARTPRYRRGTVHLLPNYDEYFIAYRDRSAVAGRAGDTKLVTGWDILNAHVVFVDGALVGRWRRYARKGTVALRFEPVISLTRNEKAGLEREVGRYEKFVGMPVILE